MNDFLTMGRYHAPPRGHDAMQVDLDILEQERLSALDRYDILDTPPETAFDRLTRLARNIFEVPIATVTFIDGHRQWFKSRQGLAEQEGCKSASFCNVAIRQDEPLVVPDTHLDDRFKSNPLVLGAPHIRFYAGAQLRTPDNYGIGTLCAIDTKPRVFDQRSVDILCDLAAAAMSELETHKLVSTDGLTSALSRHSFRSEAERAVALALRHGHALSCIAFDIDHFKNVNDTLGHAIGDLVLKRAVQACRDRLRHSDILGRTGGEEFAIVLPHTTVAAALKVAEEIRGTLAALRFAEEAAALDVSASFGVAGLDRLVRDLDELLRRADNALYAAKNGGRNRCAAWEAPVEAPGPGALRRVFKAGQIAFNTGQSVIDCTVRGLSEQGASLDVISSAGVPETFKLLIRADGLARRCSIIAKMNKRIEVAFQ